MRHLIAVLLTLGLTACSSVSIDDYYDRQPVFSPETFFSGALRAHGVVKDYKGYASRSFVADITACWQIGVGTLDEHFVFDDGEKQTRIWTLSQTEGAVEATAGDVKGVGQASVSGNTMFLDYVLTIQLSDGSIDVAVDDRMYLVSENVLINESTLKKFGCLLAGSCLPSFAILRNRLYVQSSNDATTWLFGVAALFWLLHWL